MKRFITSVTLICFVLMGFWGFFHEAGAEEKIDICHIPPGNPENKHTITINKSALDAHLAHGDSVGTCEPENDDDNDNNDSESVLGSITVCKLIAGEDNIPTNGAEKPGSMFSLSWLDFDGNGTVPAATGIISSSMFSTPLSFTTDIIGNDSVNDAQCVVHKSLSLGSYFYDQEQTSATTTTGWNTPRYNDQHTLAVEDLHDFFAYSGELFTESTVDDAIRNTNADGHIVLTKNRPHRTLVVLNTFEENEEHTACSDETDNDGDGRTDEADSGCHTDGNKDNPDSYNPNDNDENSKPVITVVGTNPFQLTVGAAFTDPGATAFDEEDGDITSSIVVSGDTVNTTDDGTYVIRYNVTDSDSAAAEEKTRSVQVNSQGGSTPRPQCSDEADNDLDLLADEEDPGCHTDGNANNGNSYNSEDNDETNENPPQASSQPSQNSGGQAGSSSGGGGGGSRITLEITNEAVSLNAEGAVNVTWNTNLQATSQVLYDRMSHGSTTTPPAGGLSHSAYLLRTATSTAFVTSHQLTITGLAANTGYFFRPVSAREDEDAMGKELKITPATTTVTALPAPVTTATTITRQPCQKYLLRYIKIGENNDPMEVRKLEAFLNIFEGFSLPVDGVYDKQDFDAVGTFQERYFDDILKPWGHTKRTGYVYYTTQKKINEIICHRPFPLNAAQLAEVEEFRALIERLRQQGVAPETVLDTESIGKAEETDKDKELAKGEEKNQEATGTEDSLLGTILAQPQEPKKEENPSLTARILDAIDERSRTIGFVLIILAILIAAAGIWRSRTQ